jgi:ABC-2 type transport system ATP-binding protein
VLVAKDVEKRYGSRPALAGVSLEVAPGQVFSLLGPNGAGKSTFLSIAAGLRQPDAGIVLVDGAPPSRVRSRIGWAPQDTALYEILTVRENLLFFCDLVGLRRRTAACRIEELAEALMLRPLLDRAASQLSGGERRRLHTAIAFVNCPPLLLLDEATVGADVETRAALIEVVRAAADDGAAVVYSTHYLPEVEALGGTVGILVDGRLVATGPLESLVARHGRCAIELTFDGAPPSIDFGEFPTIVDGSTVRVETPEPSRSVPEIMSKIGPRTANLRAVEVRHPDLDSVFLALTGRRYAA